ncbi:lysophospholipid acyltransferase family protein [Flavobacteriaceae bacterium S356]|uniref:Lysophospholipid acyltransferase family protein n=1 Tax=Asprobacillus argus TaxID=3076534 RepID=A0ABU3LBV8_9FLAO|nr:lysophospholipid acyltransferase family protein [Flavobacteriaceae bacterium S356]
MKILSYLLSPIFGLVFFLILLLFHPLQWIGLKIGYRTHKFVVDLMNLCLVRSLLLLGNTVKFKKHYEIPKNATIIFAANHQSLFDIPPMIWWLRKHHPKFVSKIELGKGIPSVSFNLKYGGGALIDRKDPKKALLILADFAKRLKKNTWSAVIFPEGTRSRDGKPKSFSVNGLKMMIRHNPEAYIVPISINNSWKVFKYGSFPLGLFNKITVETHQPIHLKDKDINEALSETEVSVKKHITQS